MIAFLAPYEEILTTGRQVIEDLSFSHKVHCCLGGFDKGVEIARTLENQGIEAIVTRGGMAELISKSDVQVPVVEIPITFQDLAESLVEAKKLTGLDSPRIAVLAFRNMIHSIEVFARVMDVKLMIYPLRSADEIPYTVSCALEDRSDVLIGGMSTIKLAMEQGMKTVLLISGKDSFRTAFLQADNVLYARQLEKERMQKFRVLVDYSVQGIISIDGQKRIDVFNDAAERLLGYSAAGVIGADVESVCPSLPIDDCLREGRVLHGELMNINHRKFMVNIVPINNGQIVTGAMITIEDVGQIIEKEATIRREIYSKGLTARYHFKDILGISEEITEVKRVAQEYSGIDATVLITGQSGTGKELFAQSIHNASKRQRGPFVAVNCGSIPSNLLESELFGYVEGAFTGASKKGKAGLFELAHTGTIFLDEIGEMDKVAQTSLLRVIQERRIMRLGDNKYLSVDVRIIAATNKNLEQLVKKGRFREDLYYRINVLPLEIPVLQKRYGDAVCIAEHFVKLYNEKYGRAVVLDEQAKECINVHEWTGNVRQLRNMMERLVVVSKQKYISAELINSILGITPARNDLQVKTDDRDFSEKGKIIRILGETQYNQKEAAKQLGINRTTLYRKMKLLQIEVKKMCNK